MSSVMPIDKQKAALIEQAAREADTVEAKTFSLEVHLDLVSCQCLVGNLQLALRHPSNTGPSSTVARQVIEGIIERVRSRGLLANAAILELGDDPMYDEESRHLHVAKREDLHP